MPRPSPRLRLRAKRTIRPERVRVAFSPVLGQNAAEFPRRIESIERGEVLLILGDDVVRETNRARSTAVEYLCKPHTSSRLTFLAIGGVNVQF